MAHRTRVATNIQLASPPMAEVVTDGTGAGAVPGTVDVVASGIDRGLHLGAQLYVSIDGTAGRRPRHRARPRRCPDDHGVDGRLVVDDEAERRGRRSRSSGSRATSASTIASPTTCPSSPPTARTPSRSATSSPTPPASAAPTPSPAPRRATRTGTRSSPASARRSPNRTGCRASAPAITSAAA